MDQPQAQYDDRFDVGSYCTPYPYGLWSMRADVVIYVFIPLYSGHGVVCIVLVFVYVGGDKVVRWLVELTPGLNSQDASLHVCPAWTA